ncbi:hypothetical protein L218DRAFT_475206 [Marasmius fiardii PR-910]|nr:hypothetical protein L218DRAFT_475206 [Marasmius fiardii PR-910]
MFLYVLAGVLLLSLKAYGMAFSKNHDHKIVCWKKQMFLDSRAFMGRMSLRRLPSGAKLCDDERSVDDFLVHPHGSSVCRAAGSSESPNVWLQVQSLNFIPILGSYRPTRMSTRMVERLRGAKLRCLALPAVVPQPGPRSIRTSAENQ